MWVYYTFIIILTGCREGLTHDEIVKLMKELSDCDSASETDSDLIENNAEDSSIVLNLLSPVIM